MTSGELYAVRGRIKNSHPPSDLDILKEISDLEWKVTSDDQVDIYCEILLRISADVIVCAADMEGSERSEYEEIFRGISNIIKLSGILDRSTEIAEYFDKYSDYMSDF